MGGWAVAQSPILKTTIKVSILRSKGYINDGSILKIQSFDLVVHRKRDPSDSYRDSYRDGGVRGAPHQLTLV